MCFSFASSTSPNFTHYETAGINSNIFCSYKGEKTQKIIDINIKNLIISLASTSRIPLKPPLRRLDDFLKSSID